MDVDDGVDDGVEDSWSQLPLGKPVSYVETYTPSLLRGIGRDQARERLGLRDATLPFRGLDRWCAYELTWLNPRGRPECGVLELEIPCTSPSFVESKSLKLYLNSFSQTEFASVRDLERTLSRDLGQICLSEVQVHVVALHTFAARPLAHMPGRSLDTYDIDARHYNVEPELLALGGDAGEVTVRETLFSDLLRMRCPMTGQPDVASIIIEYTGRAIAHVGLLRYLISYRRESCFHEQAIERIFLDIKARCAPDALMVYGRFCRRGGIDINPLRTTSVDGFADLRMARQ